jgi:hypothetical protein
MLNKIENTICSIMGAIISIAILEIAIAIILIELGVM